MNLDPALPPVSGQTTPPAVPADQDAFCSRCQYNLRGVAEPRCPECGTPFDPATLATSLIPWVHRKGIGRIRAFVRTTWQATFHPRRLLLPEAAREISFRDGRRFRWTALAVLLVGLGLISGVCAISLDANAADKWMYILIFAPPAIAAAVAVWTGTACWFSMPKRLDATRRQRTAALVEYTIAPAVLLLIPAALAGVQIIVEGNGGAWWQGLFGATAGLIAFVLLVLWWVNTLSIISRLTERSGGGKFAIGLTLAVFSPLLTIIAVGLPILAVLYWLIMYYSLSV